MTTFPSDIPEAAVEAAFVALDAMRSYPNTLMDYLSSEKVARAALEAAAPHMLADGWAKAYAAGFMDARDGNNYNSIDTNPYRTAK